MKLLEYFETSAAEMLDVVREHGLEGVVAKRLDSPYEPGRRSGAWIKHRIAQQQDFLIGGYIPGTQGIDSLIVGDYIAKDLMYVSRVRAGLVPASRRKLFQNLQPLVIKTCPFVNLPETGRSRWGESLTAEKMKQCVWVEPKFTARIEFLERTGEGGCGIRGSCVSTNHLTDHALFTFTQFTESMTAPLADLGKLARPLTAFAAFNRHVRSTL